MKSFKTLMIGLFAAAVLTAPVMAQTNLNRAEPGYRLIDGSTINGLIDAHAADAAAITALQGQTTGSFCATFAPLGAPAAATDTVFYVATRAVTVTAVSEVHAVAAGGASSLQVTKDSGTDAPGAGANLLTNNTDAGFNLNATANTVQNGTLVTTEGTTTLAAGDRLAVDFANAIQSSSGIAVTACMTPQ